MINYSRYLQKKSCTIFLFHGVINQNKFKLRNYTKKHLEKKKFIKILYQLKKNGNPISMDEVVKTSDKGKDFKDKSFAITFDDGFYNNYAIAVPILKKMKIPATFYITTDFINKNLTSWIDRIEMAVSEIDFGTIKICQKKIGFKKTLNSKIKFMRNIRYLIKNRFGEDPYEITNKILKDLKYKKKVLNSNHILDRKMNWNQVRKINNSKFFLIGGHSMTHKILSFLDDKEVKKEIKKSIEIIEKKLKKKIIHYSYPEGLNYAYSTREVKLLKKFGIKCCPTAETGVNTKKTNLFKLKRITCI
jgi:peptidoglycan/xylan/chitin deacetylase (PgdA/CDA1 family)